MQINLKQSPYYQLYDPPPSYDTVVQIADNDLGGNDQPSTSTKLKTDEDEGETTAQQL